MLKTQAITEAHRIFKSAEFAIEQAIQHLRSIKRSALSYEHVARTKQQIKKLSAVHMELHDMAQYIDFEIAAEDTILDKKGDS